MTPEEITLSSIKSADALMANKGFTFKDKSVVCTFPVVDAAFYWLLKNTKKLVVRPAE